MVAKVVEEVSYWVARMDCVVVGPGLGRDPFMMVSTVVQYSNLYCTKAYSTYYYYIVLFLFLSAVLAVFCSPGACCLPTCCGAALPLPCMTVLRRLWLRPGRPTSHSHRRCECSFSLPDLSLFACSSLPRTPLPSRIRTGPACSW